MPAKSAAYSPDGSLLAIQAGDGGTLIINPATAEVVADLSESGDRIVGWSADGRYLALLTYAMVIVFERPKANLSENKNFPLTDLFKAPKRIRRLLLGQAEGIAFSGRDLLITTESNPLLRRPGQIWTIGNAIPMQEKDQPKR